MRLRVLLLIGLLALCVPPSLSRGGGRGGGGRSSSRGSSSRGSSSHSYSSHSTSHSTGHSVTTSASKGNWFTNLFRSKSSSPASSSSSSSSSSNAKPAAAAGGAAAAGAAASYPRQPASYGSNPSVPHHHGGADTAPPPSYGSLYGSAAANGKPPSYGWATGATAAGGMNRGYAGAGGGYRPDYTPQNSFSAFKPQNYHTSTSYHFIPIILPQHYGTPYYGNSYHYGSRASPSSSVSASSSADNATTATTMTTTRTTPPPLLSVPVVYEMDTSALRPNSQLPAAALVLAVNNMVVYGDMRGSQHLVMVIDENPVDVGPIPEHFLNYVDADEITDFVPTHRTTTSATLAAWPPTEAPPMSTQAAEVNASTTTAVPMTVESTTLMPISTAETAVRNQSTAAADEHVLDNQWFSDVDGAL